MADESDKGSGVGQWPLLSTNESEPAKKEAKVGDRCDKAEAESEQVSGEEHKEGAPAWANEVKQVAGKKKELYKKALGEKTERTWEEYKIEKRKAKEADW